MTTVRTYLRDAMLLDTTGVIRAIDATQDGKARIQLDHTVFHPQGGGQPSDVGTIGPARVLHVASGLTGDVVHVVEPVSGLGVGDSVRLHVDAEARQRHARYHTAGHLVAGVVEGLQPTLSACAGHHWPGEARVEFNGRLESDAEELRHRLGDLLMDAIQQDLLVKVEGDPFAARKIRIGDFAAVPCGGTHLTSLSPLVGLCVTRLRVKDGRVRISYSV